MGDRIEEKGESRCNKEGWGKEKGMRRVWKSSEEVKVKMIKLSRAAVASFSSSCLSLSSSLILPSAALLPLPLFFLLHRCLYLHLLRPPGPECFFNINLTLTCSLRPECRGVKNKYGHIGYKVLNKWEITYWDIFGLSHSPCVILKWKNFQRGSLNAYAAEIVNIQ